MTQIKIPDLGDFDEVEVVEVHVKSGQSIKEKICFHWKEEMTKNGGEFFKKKNKTWRHILLSARHARERKKEKRSEEERGKQTICTKHIPYTPHVHIL